MALLQNRFLQNQLPVHWRAGVQGNSRSAYGKGDRLNQSSGFSQLASTPAGNYPPTTWIMPRTAGSMSSRNLLTGTGEVDPLNMAAGINLESALDGSGDFTGTAQLIISIVAAISGSGSLTASIQGFLQLSASLAGSGDLNGSITALANAVAEIEGTGDLDSTIRALGTLGASINVTGDILTTANVADSVWNALALAFGEAGTMGELLNNSGAGGNPWDTQIDGTYTAAEVMKIVAAALAGKATGGGTTGITLRDLSDTKDVVTMTVDVNGNRSSVVLDP